MKIKTRFKKVLFSVFYFKSAILFQNHSKHSFLLYRHKTNLVLHNQQNVQKAKRRRKAIIKQKRPMASDRANPRMAYEKSCCLREGLRAQPMMRDPKTDPIPAPDPATPTVAAPAPMNLAAESMSLRAAEVERARLVTDTGADVA